MEAKTIVSGGSVDVYLKESTPALTRLEQFVQYLKDSGDWDNLSYIGIYDINDTESTRNIKTGQIQAQLVGSCTTSNDGIDLNGVDQYIRTNQSIADINDTCAGGYVEKNNDTNLADRTLLGCSSGPVDYVIYQREAVPREARFIIGNKTVVDYVGDGKFQDKSMYSIRRASLNDLLCFKDSVQVGTSGTSSIGDLPQVVAFGAKNVSATSELLANSFLQAKLRFGWIGNKNVSHYNIELIWRYYLTGLPINEADFNSGFINNIAYINQNNVTFDGQGLEYRNIYLENCDNINISNAIIIANQSIIQSCNNVTLTNVQFIDSSYTHYVRVYGDCDTLIFDNIRMELNNLDYFGDEIMGIQLKGQNVLNVELKNSYFLNMPDAIQATITEGQLNDVSGLTIHDNTFITSPEWKNGTENAIDLKVAALTGNILIYNNTISGYYESDTSAGDAILVHRDCINVLIYDNTITDCLYALGIKPYNPTGGSGLDSFIDRGVFYNGININMAGVNVTKHIPI